MRSLRVFAALVRWDFVRELRRKETVPSMVLFALLVLFLAHAGIGQDPALVSAAGPVVFWIAVLFAGTIGLAQSFAAEREGGTLGAILVAPVGREVVYFAKIVSVGAYAFVMEAAAVGLYAVLFNANFGARVAALVAVLALFTIAYLAIGVVAAAMATALRGGGEVLLRILLVPLMIPMIWLTLRVSETVFDARLAGGALGPPLDVGTYAALAAALDAIYVTLGCVLFTKALEA
ncbi:MAG: heme exporter protein CcmB [Planctomycetota bacterium]